MSGSARDMDVQAWTWIVRRDGPDWSEAEEAALGAWLDENPLHRGALLQAEAMWEAFDASVGDAGEDRETGDEAGEAIAAGRFSRRAWLGGAGAAIAASLAGGLIYLGGGQSVSTEVGEIRRVPLADGSVAALNTASRLAIHMRRDVREVRLEQGEAWFQVAKDKARPFVVAAGQVRVRAVGTAFAVRQYPGHVEVTVSEGVVEAWIDGDETKPVRLRAGEHALIGERKVETWTTQDAAIIDQRLAWRNGRLDFVGTPVASAVNEINRYNRRKIELRDAALGAERFDGVFRTDDPETFALAVRNSLSAKVDLADPAKIVISR